MTKYSLIIRSFDESFVEHWKFSSSQLGSAWLFCKKKLLILCKFDFYFAVDYFLCTRDMFCTDLSYHLHAGAFFAHLSFFLHVGAFLHIRAIFCLPGSTLSCRSRTSACIGGLRNPEK